ncbi:hypothetical protein MJO28_015990 [Puccinia striiformis f. sp. tritici]|uniref:Uncharacterized protein n=1 Tax=Puccinia striiformis f. sp. tritici TaxID=168172 RepID=A0ACC0DQC9_9BASI|nr:uncharacterized protein Pst134EA_032501 [Puccinia striiformis f. sp. tritici]XP_047798088.1 hypothetical protein Pst134EA_028982 [Puccinia striiformis f. sp. tritici]KAH9441031.1 hypothetical protein Pst134EB_029681 [Puccinia striiformis f. sp. tritici]KAH9441747.1 hypothetical protein Pst134EA_032501 [Puccinia striiformis f. sp. tritici]KAH9446998.1 hypothetical protein Pst134EA_028982 [Puccinia striiformis f. sp. tritici]KAI7937091.1 hypothetical protein MJO28_015990 [Puccinia striiformis
MHLLLVLLLTAAFLGLAGADGSRQVKHTVVSIFCFQGNPTESYISFFRFIFARMAALLGLGSSSRISAFFPMI